jgi:hypothetical protein
MSDIRYVYSVEEKLSREYSRVRFCVNAGASRVKGGQWLKYRVNVGTNKGILRDFAGAKNRARHVLRTKPIGTTVQLQAVRLDPIDVVATVKFRKVSSAPPVADTEGVEGIDRFVGWVNAESRAGRLKGVRYAGICVCKHPSDHADCAAVDIFATEESMEAMRHEALTNVAYYHTKYTILYRTISFPTTSQPYYGDYHAHLHLSVNGGIHDAACR